MTAETADDLRQRRDQAARVADLVELRLDAQARPDVAAALAGRTGPVIVTCRPRWEGGGFDGPEEARLGLLAEAAALGADYVDVEWRADYRTVFEGRGNASIILSVHDFDGMPPDLAERYRAMRGAGADVVKIAATPRTLCDTLALGAIGRTAAGAAERVVLVAMGGSGAVTRILPGRFGSIWSYAGEQVAPGQMTCERLLEEFRFRETTPATRIYGLAGRPVGHSLSPAMHNAAFRACGLDAVYVPLETSDPADFLEFATRLGLDGASVTTPLKVGVLAAVDQADATSAAAGATNTLRWRDGQLEARNTDVEGFLAPLEGVALAGCRVALLGAGGAARAAVVGLASRGARVTVYGRDPGRAARVAALSGGAEARAGVPERGSFDLLVNATPVGTTPNLDDTPLPADRLDGGIVYDLVYNPFRTRLLRDAQAAGCRVVGGLEMLVAQAALQFEWWTGRAAPVALMREQAMARLRQTTGAA